MTGGRPRGPATTPYGARKRALLDRRAAQMRAKYQRRPGPVAKAICAADKVVREMERKRGAA